VIVEKLVRKKRFKKDYRLCFSFFLNSAQMKGVRKVTRFETANEFRK